MCQELLKAYYVYKVSIVVSILTAKNTIEPQNRNNKNLQPILSYSTSKKQALHRANVTPQARQRPAVALAAPVTLVAVVVVVVGVTLTAPAVFAQAAVAPSAVVESSPLSRKAKWNWRVFITVVVAVVAAHTQWSTQRPSWVVSRVAHPRNRRKCDRPVASSPARMKKKFPVCPLLSWDVRLTYVCVTAAPMHAMDYY